jgi:beta-1,4-N-acetylglucosaminyltransferase
VTSESSPSATSRGSASRPNRPRPRIALVGSSGGHLLQLLALREFWQEHDRFWVTFPTPDARSRLAGERVYWCHHPTNRNLPNLVRNTILAVRVLRRERPTLIVSTGAAVAVPFFYLGRLQRARTAYIEVFDRIEKATLTGRLVGPVTQHMLVQWPEQQALYPRSELVGPLL